jgi:hypothetical protein
VSPNGVLRYFEAFFGMDRGGKDRLIMVIINLTNYYIDHLKISE